MLRPFDRNALDLKNYAIVNSALSTFDFILKLPIYIDNVELIRRLADRIA